MRRRSIGVHIIRFPVRYSETHRRDDRDKPVACEREQEFGIDLGYFADLSEVAVLLAGLLRRFDQFGVLAGNPDRLAAVSINERYNMFVY